MRLVILDRDDTVIRVPPGRRYLHGDDEIVLIDDAVFFLQKLSAAGVVAAIATNQQGVALAEHPGMTLESVDHFHRRLLEELHRQGAPVARVYVCPHAAESMCACRKPRPGLFLQAMQEFGVVPEETAAIGDQWRDAQAALAAGIRTVFLMRPDNADTHGTTELAAVRTVSSFDECLASMLT